MSCRLRNVSSKNAENCKNCRKTTIDDARRLMEVKTKQQQLGRQAEELNVYVDRAYKDIAEQNDKIDRAQKTF